MCEIVLKS